MQPNCFIATTASTLAIGGSETELFLSNITTLTGETVTTAQFATMGRGVITVDPLSTTSIEFMSFTGVDQIGVGFTGLVRGLSSLSNSVVSTNIKYHPIGTQVIIAFGVHNLLDLKTYINNVATGSVSISSNTVAGTIFSTANNASTRSRALSSLVTQQVIPNMTLTAQNFTLSDQAFDVSYAGGTTTTYTAPVSNPRIDLLVYDPVNSVLAYRTGTEAGSPTKPTPNINDIVLCSIYHKVGEVGIKDTNDSSSGVGSYGYIYSWYYPGVYLGSIPSGTIIESAVRTSPYGYLPADGSAVSRTTYANLFSAIAPSQTATISNASPAVVTAAAHNLVAGDLVHFTTTGSLPSGLVAGTAYYVISVGLTSGAFELALSPAGSAINTTTAGNGTHTLYKSSFGIGDGSTTFTLPDRRGGSSLGLGNTNIGTPRTISLAFDTTTVGTNTIAVPDISFPAQGQVITLTGTLPTGLATATTYYVQRVSSTSIKLASTQALANSASADLTFTTTGMSGVCYIVYTPTVRTVMGKGFGEETHGIATTELAAHTHPNVMELGSTGFNSGGSGNVINSNSITGSTGNNVQHNIIHPVGLYNFYIKT